MDDNLIKDKIINGEELSEEEIQYIIWEWKAEDGFEEGKHHRWWVATNLIYKIDDKYYSIWYQSALTECQESYYPAQVAARVEKKPITTYKWEKVK